MATDEGTGTNKLVERILADARADAQRTSDEAEQSVRDLTAEGDKLRAEKAEEARRKREIAVSAVRDGCRTRASLEGRKDALRKKRAVIDAAFDAAYDKALAMDEQARKAVCRRMLQSEAEDNETVVPAKADRAALAALLDEGCGGRLKLANEDAPIDGGFLLKGDGYEKDCSFASLMRQLRDDEETAVAKRLFD